MANEEEGARSFAHFIQTVADGDVHRICSEKLHELTSTLQDEALKRSAEVTGEFTLKLKVKVDDRGFASIGCDVRTKEPAPRLGAGVMWVTKGGNLTPENPRQQQLPGVIREVPRGDGNVREANGPSVKEQG